MRVCMISGESPKWSAVLLPSRLLLSKPMVMKVPFSSAQLSSAIFTQPSFVSLRHMALIVSIMRFSILSGSSANLFTLAMREQTIESSSASGGSSMMYILRSATNPVMSTWLASLPLPFLVKTTGGAGMELTARAATSTHCSNSGITMCLCSVSRKLVNFSNMVVFTTTSVPMPLLGSPPMPPSNTGPILRHLKDCRLNCVFSLEEVASLPSGSVIL
mmetsp:Transcript_1367/g.3001  ORF Transcript_1367/g.3001 Transcript_1367/m.3001 type:complete len:217 (+) Transcript_1367:113-763(+)